MSEINNVLPFSLGTNHSFKEAAIEKIRKEDEETKINDQIEVMLRETLLPKLIEFIDQSEEIAEVVYRTPRTVDDLCFFIKEEVQKQRNHRQAMMLSDIMVYSMMLKFYFPEAEVKSKIYLEFGEKPSDEEINKPYERPKKEVKPTTTSTTSKKKTDKKGGKKSTSDNLKEELLKKEKEKEAELQASLEALNGTSLDEMLPEEPLPVKDEETAPKDAALGMDAKSEQVVVPAPQAHPIEETLKEIKEEHTDTRRTSIIDMNDLPAMPEEAEKLPELITDIPEEEEEPKPIKAPNFCEECGEEEFAIILEYNFSKFKRHLCHRCADKELEARSSRRKTKKHDGIIELDLIEGQMALI